MTRFRFINKNSIGHTVAFIHYLFNLVCLDVVLKCYPYNRAVNHFNYIIVHINLFDVFTKSKVSHTIIITWFGLVIHRGCSPSPNHFPHDNVSWFTPRQYEVNWSSIIKRYHAWMHTAYVYTGLVTAVTFN